MASAKCFGVKDKEIKRQVLSSQNTGCPFWQTLPDYLHLPHLTDEVTGISRGEMTGFRFVKKLGLEPRFLNSKTRVYYVMVERKYPHCKPQNSSKDWQSHEGLGAWFLSQQRKAHPAPFFGLLQHTPWGCSHWVTEHSILAWKARWLVIPMKPAGWGAGINVACKE